MTNRKNEALIFLRRAVCRRYYNEDHVSLAQAHEWQSRAERGLNSLTDFFKFGGTAEEWDTATIMVLGQIESW